MNIQGEVYNALADIMFRHAGKATKADMERAIEYSKYFPACELPFI